MKTLDHHTKKLLKEHNASVEEETDDEVQYRFPSSWHKEQFEFELDCIKKAHRYHSLHPISVEKLIDVNSAVAKPNTSIINHPDKWEGKHWRWLFGDE